MTPVRAPTTPWMPDWLARDAHGGLLADGVPLTALAERFGTPLHVYSQRAIERTWHAFAQAVAGRPVRICYALKANPRLALVDLFRRLGAGFDIVSDGELDVVLAAGADPSLVLYSGVGKPAAAIERAIGVGVGCFNVESEAELERIAQIAARMGRRAPVSVRVNPDVDAATHPYISTGLRENKFGIAHERAPAVYRRACALPSLHVVGIDCHIGSQITDTAPFLAALDRIISLVDALRADGIPIAHMDLGGGLGIRYRDEQPPEPAALMHALFERLQRWPGARDTELRFEFGRSLIGNAGVLLTRTEYLKRNGDRHFAVVDAAMTELMRPTLYDAWHTIVVADRAHADPAAAATPIPGAPEPAAPDSGAPDPGASNPGALDSGASDSAAAAPPLTWDVVGPVCESGDWLGRQRELPGLREGDLLTILSTGAYGSSMGSNYNSRPRPAEVLLVPGADGAPATPALIRERESPQALLALERLPAR